MLQIAQTATKEARAPRVSPIARAFAKLETIQAEWVAKAYAVADRLKKVDPKPTERDCRAQTLIAAAFAMGSTLEEVAELAQYLSERPV